MGKTLVIIEAPKKAKQIQKYLGPDYTVCVTGGHIKDLALSGPSKLGVDIEHGFIPKYTIIDGKLDKIRTFLQASYHSDQVLIASDPDREGEAIAFHVKECLAGYTKPIKRVLFEELTKNGVTTAINNPIELNENLYKAQQARRVLDRIVGFLVSKYVINLMHQKNLSAGRVQSIAVKLIVDREKEIEAFQPEEYWNIFGCLSKDGQKFQAKIQEKVNNKDRAEEIKSDLLKSNLFVKQIKKAQKPKYPEPPFKTATLLTTASIKFGFSTDKITKCAQTLYEGGFITYPRPDSVKSAPEAIEAVRNWLTQNSHPIPTKPYIYQDKDETVQGAHEAIRPTNIANLPDKVFLPEEELKIYKLIWERFVASQMNPAIFDTVEIFLESNVNFHQLKTSGKLLSSPGWLAISSDLLKVEKKDITLPNLEQNEILDLIAPKVKTEQKFTQPPSRYSEATIVKELDDRKIGRPSTFNAIASKIFQRSFVEKRGGVCYPTELGRQVMDLVSEDFDFMQYAYTAEMENQLDQISHGKLSYYQMLEDFFKNFSQQLHYAYDKHQKDYGFVCELCQNPMYLKHGYYGFYLACKNYPHACNNSKACDIENDLPVIKQVLEPKIDGKFCPKCSNPMVKKDFRHGPFFSCSAYPRCKTYLPVPVEGVQCPKCSGEMKIWIKDDQIKLTCLNYKETGCSVFIDVPKGLDLKWIKPLPQLEDHSRSYRVANKIDHALVQGPKPKIKRERKKKNV